MRKTVCDCNIIHGDKVERAIKNTPPGGRLDRLGKLFKVMGDDTRIKIIWLLDHDELCVCDVCNILNMTKSAVSHQLAILKEYRIVTSRREGKEVFYRLNDSHITALCDVGMEHINHSWEERV